MPSYLVDSSVIIDHFRYSPRVTSVLDECSRKGALHLSVLIKAEVLVGTPVADEAAVLEFLANFEMHEVDEELALEGARYRRRYLRSHGTSLADGIIAATARKYDLVLLSRNKKHFPMEDIKKQFI